MPEVCGGDGDSELQRSIFWLRKVSVCLWVVEDFFVLVVTQLCIRIKGVEKEFIRAD